jgi:hypothetical protein
MFRVCENALLELAELSTRGELDQDEIELLEDLERYVTTMRQALEANKRTTIVFSILADVVEALVDSLLGPESGDESDASDEADMSADDEDDRTTSSAPAPRGAPNSRARA